MSNKIETVSIGDLPIATELDDADELLLRDVSATLPENATARLSIATLRAAMGGGADDWSEFPATSSVDMDGHGLTNLPTPSAASDAATKGYVDARPGAEKWSEHAATQDVDLDGHKLTGLGEPTEEDDAATKGYVDGAAPAKIELAGSRVEVLPNGNIEIWRDGQRRLRIETTNVDPSITLSTTNGSSTTALRSGGSEAEIYAGNSTRIGVEVWNGGRVYLYSGGTRYFLAVNGDALPAGVDSVVQAARRAYERRADVEWWEPTWTPVINVDSVSNVECSYTRTYRAAGGSLVTLEGTIEVTPEAAGQCAVQVDLPIARDGSGLLAGTAMAMEVAPPGHVVAVASVAETTLTLGFVAEGADPYLVGFRISYRAA